MRDTKELKGFIEMRIHTKQDELKYLPEHSPSWIAAKNVLDELEYILDNYLH